MLGAHRNYNDVSFTAEGIHFYPYHVSSDLRIYYVLSGTIEMHNVSGKIVLQEGDIEFVSIREATEIVGLTEENLVLTMTIKTDYLKLFEKKVDSMMFNVNAVQFYPCEQRNMGIENYENVKQLKTMFMVLFKEYSKTHSVDAENLKNMVLLILNGFNDIAKHFTYLKNTDEHIIKRFIRIENYIVENISEKLSLTDLAAVEYLTPQYLSGEFQKKFNRTFGNLLEYYRVKAAVALILESDMKMTQIGRECGFSDSKYFYRAFKSLMNCTPAEFKRTVVGNKVAATIYYELDSKKLEKYFSTGKDEGMEAEKNTWISQLALEEIYQGYFLSKPDFRGGITQRYCLFTDAYRDKIFIQDNEIWFYHCGEPLEIEINDDCRERITLGSDKGCIPKAFFTGSINLSLKGGKKGFTLISRLSI